MASSKAWGMAVYEQDWLHNEWEGLNSRRRACHFADTPSPPTLKHLPKGEGGVPLSSLMTVSPTA